jgi:hypothetical protein
MNLQLQGYDLHYVSVSRLGSVRCHNDWELTSNRRTSPLSLMNFKVRRIATSADPGSANEKDPRRTMRPRMSSAEALPPTSMSAMRQALVSSPFTCRAGPRKEEPLQSHSAVFRTVLLAVVVASVAHADAVCGESQVT